MDPSNNVMVSWTTLKLFYNNKKANEEEKNITEQVKESKRQGAEVTGLKQDQKKVMQTPKSPQVGSI